MIYFYLKKRENENSVNKKKKKKFAFLRKTAMTIIGQQKPGLTPKRKGKISLKAGLGLRKIIKKVHKRKEDMALINNSFDSNFGSKEVVEQDIEHTKDSIETMSVINLKYASNVMVIYSFLYDIQINLKI